MLFITSRISSKLELLLYIYLIILFIYIYYLYITYILLICLIYLIPATGSPTTTMLRLHLSYLQSLEHYIYILK